MLSALGDLGLTPQFCHQILQWKLKGHHHVVLHPKVVMVVAAPRSSPGWLAESDIPNRTLHVARLEPLRLALPSLSPPHLSIPREISRITCTCAVSRWGKLASLPIIYRHVCVRLSSVSGLGGRPRMGGRFMCQAGDGLGP